MTRPLQKLVDELLSSEMDSYHEVVCAADAVVQAIQHAGFLGHLVPDLGEALSSYQRAVEEWRRMNAAREAREKANE